MSKIKTLRNKIGMSQEELAKRIGVTRTAVIYWEQGKQEPKQGSVGNIAALDRRKLVN